MTAAILLTALTLTGSCQEVSTEVHYTVPITMFGRTHTITLARTFTNVVCPAGWRKTSGIRSVPE